MRIVGQIEHPVIKITVMQMNNRYVLKLKQICWNKRISLTKTIIYARWQILVELVDETFLNECLKHFSDMNKSRGETYQRNIL